MHARMCVIMSAVVTSVMQKCCAVEPIYNMIRIQNTHEKHSIGQSVECPL